jgi:hypothetical protein
MQNHFSSKKRVFIIQTNGLLLWSYEKWTFQMPLRREGASEPTKNGAFARHLEKLIEVARQKTVNEIMHRASFVP